MKCLRRFIERGRKGYTREDLWSFDNFLSNLIANGLTEFKENCHGYPSKDMTWEEWMSTLDEMIDCFREQTRSMENLTGENLVGAWRKRHECQKEKLHRGLQLLERFWYDLWD